MPFRFRHVLILAVEVVVGKSWWVIGILKGF